MSSYYNPRRTRNLYQQGGGLSGQKTLDVPFAMFSANLRRALEPGVYATTAFIFP